MAVLANCGRAAARDTPADTFDSRRSAMRRSSFVVACTGRRARSVCDARRPHPSSYDGHAVLVRRARARAVSCSSSWLMEHHSPSRLRATTGRSPSSTTPRTAGTRRCEAPGTYLSTYWRSSQGKKAHCKRECRSYSLGVAAMSRSSGGASMPRVATARRSVVARSWPSRAACWSGVSWRPSAGGIRRCGEARGCDCRTARMTRVADVPGGEGFAAARRVRPGSSNRALCVWDAAVRLVARCVGGGCNTADDPLGGRPRCRPVSPTTAGLRSQSVHERGSSVCVERRPLRASSC